MNYFFVVTVNKYNFVCVAMEPYYSDCGECLDRMADEK